MARKPMVTRTIITTQANVLCLNIETAEPFNTLVTLPRTFKDNEKLMKKVHEVVDNDSVKAVAIVDKNEVETLYGMPEEDFIENAVILDPETRRAYKDEAEIVEATEE